MEHRVGPRGGPDVRGRGARTRPLRDHRHPRRSASGSARWWCALRTATCCGNRPRYISAGLVVAVRALGPVAAVAASHPHLAGAAVSWGHMLSAGQHAEVPVLWNAHDRRWVQRPDPAYVFWADRHEPVDGISLVRAGGHFPGSCVLHWPAGADGRGVLLVGDTVMVGPERRHGVVHAELSEPVAAVRTAGAADRRRLETLAYDRHLRSVPGISSSSGTRRPWSGRRPSDTSAGSPTRSAIRTRRSTPMRGGPVDNLLGGVGTGHEQRPDPPDHRHRERDRLRLRHIARASASSAAPR